jgi:hypothetical protein
VRVVQEALPEPEVPDEPDDEEAHADQHAEVGRAIALFERRLAHQAGDQERGADRDGAADGEGEHVVVDERLVVGHHDAGRCAAVLRDTGGDEGDDGRQHAGHVEEHVLQVGAAPDGDQADPDGDQRSHEHRVDGRVVVGADRALPAAGVRPLDEDRHRQGHDHDDDRQPEVPVRLDREGDQCLRARHDVVLFAGDLASMARRQRAGAACTWPGLLTRGSLPA